MLNSYVFAMGATRIPVAFLVALVHVVLLVLPAE